MKKAILLILFIAYSLSILDAQSTSFGIKIGLNKNRIANYIDRGINPNLKVVYPKVQPLIGLYVKLPINNKFRFLSELMIGKKGAVMIYDEQRPFKNYHSVSATYLSIPVSLGYRYRFMTFEAGLDAGIKLGTKVHDSYTNWLYQDHKYDINTLLGVQFHMKRVAFSVRYLNGLLPFGEVEITDIEGNSSGVQKYGKNQTLQVALGYDLM